MMKSLRAPLTIAILIAVSGCGIFRGGDSNKTPVLGNRVPILTSETGVEVDPALAGVAVILPAAAVNDNWTQPGGNPAKSLGHLALGTQFVRAWTARIDGGSNRARLAAAPVIANGRVYAVDVDGVVHSFDASSGARVWSTPVSPGDENRSARFGGGVSVEGERLFATNGLGDVAAINAADGAVVWKVKPGGPLRGAPTLANGQIYILSQDNQLFALNQADGSVAWTESGSLETSGVFGVAAPAAAQGTIVAGFSSGELNAYRYENGRVLWQDALSRSAISTSVSSLSDIDAAPVIDQGRIFAVGQGGRMVSLEVVTGQRIWEQNVAGISTPWVAGEWVFVVTDDARLLCLARANGKVRWIAQLKRYRNEKKRTNPVSWIGPVLAGDRLVLVNSLGDIASVAPATGAVIGTTETNDSYRLPPVVAGNTLYLLGDSGTLTAYR